MLKKKLSEKSKNDVFICRVCLVTRTKKFASIFDKYKESTIYDHIVNLANVKISTDDGLPSNICDSCLLEFETAVDFKLKCEASDVFLHKTFCAPSSNDFEASALKEEKPEIQVKEEPDENEFIFEYLDCGSDVDDIESLTKNECRKAEKLSAPKRSQSVVSVQCHDCGDLFKSKCKLRVHWKNAHIPKAYICQICKKSFKKFAPYNRHTKKPTISCLKAKEVRIEGVGKHRVFHCSNCDYKARKIGYVLSHQVTHTGLRPFQCNLCPNSYTQLGVLLDHKENVHKEFRFEITCNFCGKYIRGRKNAYEHLLTHSEERYQCDICKKVLKNKKILRTHLSRHSGVKTYICDLCAAAFYTLSDLLNHKKCTHDSSGWYNCDKCGFKGRSMQLLRNHQMRHDDFEHFCATCGAFFPNAIRLKIHEYLHAEGKPKEYKCPFCTKSYLQKKERVRHHIKKKHNEHYNDVYPEWVDGLKVDTPKIKKKAVGLSIKRKRGADISITLVGSKSQIDAETPAKQVKQDKA